VVQSASNERLVHDLPRGIAKLIDEDLNVDEEGFEQNDQNLTITTTRLYWLSTHVHMSWPRQEGLFLPAQSRTQAKTEKNATKLADE
jgi:hypothetical protein